MRKFIALTLLIVCTLAPAKHYAAVSNTEMNKHLLSLYSKFKFTRYNKMSFQAFSAGVTGYYNLKEEGQLKKNILAVCDFTLPSSKKRMWILDMNRNRILLHTYVAHGQGSGENFATRFSNVPNTHASSQGFYVTGSSYNGNNGRSLKLHGMDGRYNSKAFNRAIVIHGASYVSEEFIRAHGRLGRSYGCPAVEKRLTNTVINTLGSGSAFFIYHPMNAYLKSSHWIKSPVQSIAAGRDTYIKKPEAPKAEIKEESKIAFVPKTQEDSLKAGLIAPNTRLDDGTIYVGRIKINKSSEQQKKAAQKLTLSSGIVTNSPVPIDSSDKK